jgi:DNA-directed RNA polymerase I subunit RPA1
LVKPAIEKPKQLWTGKQLVTNVIKLVVEYSDLKFKDAMGLCMKAPTKVSKAYMEGYEDESEVLVWDN